MFQLDTLNQMQAVLIHLGTNSQQDMVCMTAMKLNCMFKCLLLYTCNNIIILLIILISIINQVHHTILPPVA